MKRVFMKKWMIILLLFCIPLVSCEDKDAAGESVVSEKTAEAVETKSRRDFGKQHRSDLKKPVKKQTVALLMPRIDGYMTARKELKEENSFKNTLPLTADERKLDAIMKRYARRFNNRRNIKNAHSSPFYEKKKEIEASDLFRLIRAMPKGANLHLHANAALTAEDFFEFVRPFDNIYVLTAKTKNEGRLAHVYPGKKIPAGYEPLKEVLDSGRMTKEHLVALWSYGPEDTNAYPDERWSKFSGIFGKVFNGIVGSPQIYKEYLKTVFRKSVEDNVDHIEFRIKFPIFTRRQPGTVSGALAFRQAYTEFKKENPSFSAKAILSVRKQFERDIDEIVMEYKEMLYLKRRVKDKSVPEKPVDLIVGFDLVGNEDDLRPLSDYVPYFRLISEKTEDLNLYLHAGESLDANSNKLLDAYLLKSKRVGHGLNLYRFPALMEKFIKDDIPLEVSPISNQLLGYSPDLRGHPAVEYMKRGVPMVISSDDPLIFGNDGLSYDFFVAVTEWGLGLGEVKWLCMNSIRYSAASPDEKKVMLENWNKKWDEFVKKSLEKMPVRKRKNRTGKPVQNKDMKKAA